MRLKQNTNWTIIRTSPWDISATSVTSSLMKKYWIVIPETPSGMSFQVCLFHVCVCVHALIKYKVNDFIILSHILSSLLSLNRYKITYFHIGMSRYRNTMNSKTKLQDFWKPKRQTQVSILTVTLSASATTHCRTLAKQASYLPKCPTDRNSPLTRVWRIRSSTKVEYKNNTKTSQLQALILVHYWLLLAFS